MLCYRNTCNIIRFAGCSHLMKCRFEGGFQINFGSFFSISTQEDWASRCLQTPIKITKMRQVSVEGRDIKNIGLYACDFMSILQNHLFIYQEKHHLRWDSIMQLLHLLIIITVIIAVTIATVVIEVIVVVVAIIVVVIKAITTLITVVVG